MVFLILSLLLFVSEKIQIKFLKSTMNRWDLCRMIDLILKIIVKTMPKFMLFSKLPKKKMKIVFCINFFGNFWLNLRTKVQKKGTHLEKVWYNEGVKGSNESGGL